jgi:hypothetical protein
MTERREIEERHKKRIRNPNFGGRSNWDTYEAVNIIESDESLHRNWESWSANFNRKLREGTFNEAKAKEALRKYLLKEVKKRDEDIDLKKINMDELVDETVLLSEPLPPRKKDYAPKDVRESELEAHCSERNMDYVPGYHKDDGTYVHGYCRHTKFTEYMREKRRR